VATKRPGSTNDQARIGLDVLHRPVTGGNRKFINPEKLRSLLSYRL
jgi:hypothetical protein